MKRSYAVAIVLVVVLSGCAGLRENGKCAEWRDRDVSVQVCDRRSETGWCAASHTEHRYQRVCVRRETSLVRPGSIPVPVTKGTSETAK